MLQLCCTDGESVAFFIVSSQAAFYISTRLNLNISSFFVLVLCILFWTQNVTTFSRLLLKRFPAGLLLLYARTALLDAFCNVKQMWRSAFASCVFLCPGVNVDIS